LKDPAPHLTVPVSRDLLDLGVRTSWIGVRPTAIRVQMEELVYKRATNMNVCVSLVGTELIVTYRGCLVPQYPLTEVL